MPASVRRELLLLSGRANFVDKITTLAELDEPKQAVLVARGGSPGYGNRHLAGGEEVSLIVGHSPRDSHVPFGGSAMHKLPGC